MPELTAQSRTGPREALWFALVVSGTLLLVGIAALAVDLPFARLAREDRLPGEVRRLFDRAEFFGHGYGVLLIALTIRILDPARRRWLPRLLACAFGAGLLANVLKQSIPRIRPHVFDFSGGVLATFTGHLPLAQPGEHWKVFERSVQSFPSGHTTTAVALAVALGSLYPHGRWWFLTLAALVACQRIECGAHYPSDVLCGAALGYWFATYCLVGKLPNRCFARWEDTPPTGGAPAAKLAA